MIVPGACRDYNTEGAELWFPCVENSTHEGIVATGGDLSPRRLLLAYKSGIFPWYSPGQPILWWSPDPRAIIPLEKIRINRTLRKIINRDIFEIRINSDFDKIIRQCASRHKEDSGAGWLTEDMINAYTELHRLGHAHSIEAWSDGELAGGLYGVCVGGLFAGESMFYCKANASKVALAFLVKHLIKRGFTLLDCQMVTEITARMGAIEITRKEYLKQLAAALEHDCTF